MPSARPKLIVILVACSRALLAAGRFISVGAVQACGVCSVMHLLRLGAHEAHGVDPALQ